MSKKYAVTSVAAAAGALLTVIVVLIVKRSRSETPPISPTVPRVDDQLPVDERSSGDTSATGS